MLEWSPPEHLQPPIGIEGSRAMNERAQALEVLRRARDLLIHRLTERILDAEEGLLDDARGDSYLGDIETIYDQFGTKLTHLNQLINNLPQEAEAAPQCPADFSGGDYVGSQSAAAADEVIPSYPGAITGPLIIAPPALPAPRMEEEFEIAAPSFAGFAAQIRGDELRDAARTLSVLMDISEARGMQCVRIFHRRWEDDESFLLKAMQLRGEVISSSYNSALMLLAECFGLVGIEAIGVLQTLRSRFVDRDD
jgi:hypothetical protein